MIQFFKKKSIQPKSISSLVESALAAETSLGAKVLSVAIADSIDAIAITDLDGKHIYVNRSWEKMWGYSLKEAFDMMIPQMVAEEELAKLTKEILPSVMGEGFWVGRCLVLRKDKSKFLVSMRVSLIKDGNEKPIGIMASFIDITESKLIEEKYKLLYETSSAAIMTIEPPDWKFTAGNPAAIKMFNCKDEKEFITLGPWNLSPEKQPDGQLSVIKAQKMIMQAMKEGVNFFEWVHTRYKDGDFPATVLLNRFKQDGKYIVQATVRDVSEEKKAQEKIIEFSSLTKKHLSNIIPVLQKVAMGNFSENIKIPEEDDEFKELFLVLKRMIKDLKEIKKESDKHEKSLENAKIAARNILHDFRFERDELSKAKAKQDALLASIGDGIIATDSDGKIIIMNKVAEKLLGWKINEAIGRFYDEVVLLEDEKGIIVSSEDKPLQKAFIQGVTTTTTTGRYLISKNKIKFPVAITVSPVILGNKTIGAVEVFRDVTREREIDRAKTEFVSLASHQLRTPLTGIYWLTEMMLNGDLGKISGEQRKVIEVILSLAKQMVELISALLNVSRLEMGTFSVNPESVIQTEIIDQILLELKFGIVKKEIKIVKSYPAKMLPINADPILLKIIYQNLLSNAVRYALPNTIIDVKISKKNDSLLFAVINRGIGIPQKDQPKIFTKLFRASNAQIFVTDGTGLGLYIVKQIIDTVGGKIWFNSELNKKTEFYVSLPLGGMVAKKGDKSLEIK